MGWVFGSTIGYGSLVNTSSLLEGRPLASNSLAEKPLYIISLNLLLCLDSLQLL